MEILTVKKLAWMGVLFCALGLSACAKDDGGWIEDEAVWVREETETDMVPEVSANEIVSEPEDDTPWFDFVSDGCKSEEDECEASEDYLTNQFSQTVTEEDAAIALSRPASQKAVSVKEKQAAKQKADREKVLYTPRAIPETTSRDDIQVMQAADVVVDVPATTEELVADEGNDVVSISESTSQGSNMVPLKKVKTTITETTTKIRREKTPEELANMSLADRIRYGEDMQDWEANAGSTLRTLLLEWGEQSGWTVVWKLDRDYNLEAGVIFRGTFTEVASALIRSFARATPAPIGTFYQGNRVLVISTQEDENER